MNREKFLNDLCLSLHGPEAYIIKNMDGYRWDVESSLCRISVIYDKYGDGAPVISISKPFTDGVGMNIFLLRHLRHVADAAQADKNSGLYIATILNTYFQDLLFGDFSIQKSYDEIAKKFFALSFEVRLLPDSDEIKKKFVEYDISWLDDFSARKQGS